MIGSGHQQHNDIAFFIGGFVIRPVFTSEKPGFQKILFGRLTQGKQIHHVKKNNGEIYSRLFFLRVARRLLQLMKTQRPHLPVSSYQSLFSIPAIFHTRLLLHLSLRVTATEVLLHSPLSKWQRLRGLDLPAGCH